jgi:hypothetical protein
VKLNKTYRQPSPTEQAQGKANRPNLARGAKGRQTLGSNPNRSSDTLQGKVWAKLLRLAENPTLQVHRADVGVDDSRNDDGS